MRVFIILSAFCFMFFVPSSSQAQGHSAFCGQAESTAASQSCLKRHLDSAQRKLNKVYNNLTNKLEGDNLEELKELQKTWLRYRDAECMWEAGRTSTPSLKRVNEMSCMARVTEDRLDLLTIALSDNSEEGVQREYGSFPRWMNVVAKDYPAVSWTYGKRSRFDLDCDGEEEFVMQGFTTKEKKLAKEDKNEDEKEGEKSASSLIFEKSVVVVIAQNPPTGRPSAKIFTFPVLNTEGENTVCSDAVTIEYAQKPKVETDGEQEGVEEPMVCGAYLKVKNKGCAPKIISWTGKEFVLEIEDKIEKIKKEDKK